MYIVLKASITRHAKPVSHYYSTECLQRATLNYDGSQRCKMAILWPRSEGRPYLSSVCHHKPRVRGKREMRGTGSRSPGFSLGLQVCCIFTPHVRCSADSGITSKTLTGTVPSSLNCLINWKSSVYKTKRLENKSKKVILLQVKLTAITMIVLVLPCKER